MRFHSRESSHTITNHITDAHASKAAKLRLRKHNMIETHKESRLRPNP